MLQLRIAIVRETKAEAPDESPKTRTRWRHLAALGVLLGVVAATLVGSAGAAPTTDTRAVAFVPITPKQVWSANSINPGAAESVVVIGGTTTVPTNATTVQLEVTAKGTAAGAVELFPAGNRFGAASNHTVTWAAGSTTTAITAENVGLQNKVTVLNSSTKAAAVTVRILGYSTQVTAGDINGSGGTNGQVLTNNGAGGAIWRSPSGNDGFGAAGNITPIGASTVVASVTVPARNYLVQFSSEFENTSNNVNTVACQMLSPSGAVLARTRQTVAAAFQSGSVAMVGLGKTTGGSYTVRCYSLQGLSGTIYDARLVAVQLDNVSGTFASKQQSRGRG